MSKKKPPRQTIRFSDDRQHSGELESLCNEIGHQWPPRSPAEATDILNKAGTFTPTEVRQFLNTVGYAGFESYGELDDGLIRTGKPHFHDGDHSLTAEEHTAKFFDPTFTSTLLHGLRDFTVTQQLAHLLKTKKPTVPQPTKPKDWSRSTSTDVANHIRKHRSSQKLAVRVLDFAKQGLTAHQIAQRTQGGIPKGTAQGIISDAKTQCPGFLPE